MLQDSSCSWPERRLRRGGTLTEVELGESETRRRRSSLLEWRDES